eukprot:GHVN01052902.1.p1 GENE.GHVN01052902.1~~GHVN01052902.1.p1  ORF type:complete len:1911 (-),score=125.55 GHVN01052902.1:9872-15604(-)
MKPKKNKRQKHIAGAFGVLLTLFLYFLSKKSNSPVFNASLKGGCHGNGVLFKGKCHCDLGYYGESCFSQTAPSVFGGSPKRILFVADSFEEDFIFSGRVFLARQFAEHGSEVTVLVGSPRASFEPARKKLGASGIRLGRLSENTLFVGTHPEERSYAAYEHVKNSTAYDAIFFFGETGLGYHTLLARKQGLLPYGVGIATIYDAQTRARRAGYLGRAPTHGEAIEDHMARACAELADTVVAPNKVLADRLFQYAWDVKEERVQTLSFPGLRLQTPDGKLLDRSLDEFPKRMRGVSEFVFVGRLCEDDGLLLFLSSLEHLLQKDKRQKGRHLKKKVLRVHFFGENVAGSAETEMTGAELISQKATQWGRRARITVSGNVSHKKIISYLTEKNKTRVAVLPARIDSDGFLFGQLVSAGVLVIASSLRTHKEQLHHADRKDALFTVGNHLSLSKKLSETLLGGVSPRPLRERKTDPADWMKLQASLRQAGGFKSADEQAPLVSVVITHHNRHTLLQQMLLSFEKQTYKRLELVIVDDGSTDAAATEYISALAWRLWQEKRWRVLKEPNRYVGSARNTGFRYARGKYVLFFDDDDIAKPHLVETMVQAAIQTGAEIVTGGHDIFSGNRAPGFRSAVGRKIYLGASALVGVNENCFGDSTMLVDRDFFGGSGGFTEDYGVGFEDYEFLARAVLHGAHLEAVPEALCWRRRHANTVTQTSDIKANRIRLLRAYNELFSYLHAAVQDAVRLFQAKHFESILVTSFSQKLVPRLNNPSGDEEDVKAASERLQARAEQAEPEAEAETPAPGDDKHVYRKDGHVRASPKEKKINIVYRLPSGEESRRRETRAYSGHGETGPFVVSASYLPPSGEIEILLDRGLCMGTNGGSGCGTLLHLYNRGPDGEAVETRLRHCSHRLISPTQLRIDISRNDLPQRRLPRYFRFTDGNVHGLRTTRDGLVEINTQKDAPAPTVVANTTPLIGAKSDIHFDLSLSVSNSSHYFIDASFTVKTPKNGNSELNRFLSRLATQFLEKRKMVFVVPRHLTDALVSYSFVFELTNVFGKRASAIAAVQRLEEDIPTVFIDGPSNILCSSPAVFSAFLTTDPPEGVSGLSYFWTLTAECVDGKSEDVKLKRPKGNMLAIDGNMLRPGKYTLLLKTQCMAEDRQAIFYYTHSFAVHTPAFRAEIVGGSRAVFSGTPTRVSSKLYMIEGNTLSDDTLVRAWRLSRDPFGYSISAPAKAFVDGRRRTNEAHGSEVVVDAGLLDKQKHYLYLNVTDKHGVRTSETRVHLRVICRGGREIPISLHRAVLGPAEQNKIRIRAEASLFDMKTFPRAVKWNWSPVSMIDGERFGSLTILDGEDGITSSTLELDTALLHAGVRYCVQVSFGSAWHHGKAHMVIEEQWREPRGDCSLLESRAGLALQSMFTVSCTGWCQNAFADAVRYRFVKIRAGREYPIAPPSHRPTLNLILSHGTHALNAEIIGRDKTHKQLLADGLRVRPSEMSLTAHFSTMLPVFQRTKNIRLGYELLSLVAPYIAESGARKSPATVFQKQCDEGDVDAKTLTKALVLIEEISSLARIDAADIGPHLLFYLGTILPSTLSVDQRGPVLKTLGRVSAGMQADTTASGRCYSKETAHKMLLLLEPIWKNPRNGSFLSHLINEIKDELQECFSRELSAGESIYFNTTTLSLQLGRGHARRDDIRAGPFLLMQSGDAFAGRPYRVSLTDANLMRHEHSTIESRVIEFKIDLPKTTPAQFAGAFCENALQEKAGTKLPKDAALFFSYKLTASGKQKLQMGLIPCCVMYVRGEKMKQSGWTKDGCAVLGHTNTHINCHATHTGEFSIHFECRRWTRRPRIFFVLLVGLLLSVVFGVLLFRRHAAVSSRIPLTVDEASAGVKTCTQTTLQTDNESTLETNDFKTEEE